jgi:DNA adenine methylase
MEKNILKWQGGKSNLFDGPIKNYLPPELFDPSKDITAIDAFAGGGSVFMFFLNNCPGIKRILINDFNTRLIRLYFDIKEQPHLLIEKLKWYQDKYNSAYDKEKAYLDMRSEFNNLKVNNLNSSALLMCLNRACFNGIYRENSKGEFNVPSGKKDILNAYNDDMINEISEKLNSRQIYFTSGDFSITGNYITENNTFIYLDPPYRPLSGSQSFTSYVSSPFNDDSQKRLKLFCDDAYKYLRAKVMISNSYDPKDDFLLNLYSGYRIIQINATRSSGGKNAKRGAIKENLIMNY